MPYPTDFLPHPLLLIGRDGRVAEGNSAAAALIGKAVAELPGADAEALLGQRLDRPRVRGRIRRRDGTPVPVDLAVRSLEDGRRAVIILELGAEDLVSETRGMLDLAFDTTPICAALFNTDGQYIRVNDNLCRMLGRSREQLLGRRDQEFTHPDDRAADVEAAVRILGGELDTWQTEKRFVRPDGEIVWAIANMTFLRDAAGGPLCWVGQFQEVTAHRTAEEQLRRRERQLAEAQRIARIGSWEWDAVSGELRWSEELCHLFDVREPPATGADFLELLHPDDRERVRREARLAIERRRPLAFEHRRIRADGSVREFNCRGEIEIDDQGNVARLVGTAQDVTEAREVERSLRESEELLRVGFEGAAIGKALIGPDRRVVRVNKALCRLTGYSEEELLGETFRRITHPEDVDIGTALADRTLAGEIPGYEQQKRYVRPDGSTVWVDLTVSLVRHDDGRPRYFVAQMQDISDRVRREAEERSLHRIAELVARNAPPTTVFETVADEVRQLLDAEAGLVTRFDTATGRGFVISGFTRTGSVPASAEPALASAEHTAAASIIVGGELWGTLAASFSGPPPDNAQQQLARFSDLVAMAVVNADAWEALARQAATDALTGLSNHRSFQERLRAEWGRAARYGRELSLVLLDLDHFKEVNDTYGHLVGDQVLLEVARRLTEEARDGELVARIGGEEFAWLMPETGTDGAYQAAERVRRLIESEPFPVAGPLTVSAGVCSGRHCREGDDLIRYADRALYWAKEGGRNVTFLYSEEADRMLAERPRALERVQAMASVRALARAIDSKDPRTRRHSERVAALAERLALQLGWTSKRAALLHACGLLHDVGKIGIPDEILLRAGPLNPEEYETIKRHAEMSAQITAEVLEAEQVTWVRGHHERWDGRGYPDGLVAEQIPDGAQLLALADAWDVMTESRTYKPAKSVAEALAEVAAESGRQFAPVAAEALLAVMAAPPALAAAPGT